MPPDADTLTAAERLVRKDRAIVIAAICLLCGLAWLWVLRGAGMGMSAWEMTRTGLFPHLGRPVAQMTMTQPLWSGPVGTFLLMVTMWVTMMVAMMLPSAAPMLLLYARVSRHQQSRGRMAEAPVRTGSFMAGYLSVWLFFSVLAVLLQMALSARGVLSGMMLWSVSPGLSAALLALAAVYQVSPVKAACLAHCRNPVDWLSRNWRKGMAGAFTMGVRHGAFCLGCCWALMLLLFVGGVMNVFWIAALALVALLEKLPLHRLPTGAISALVLGVWAIATLLV